MLHPQHHTWQQLEQLQQPQRQPAASASHPAAATCSGVFEEVPLGQELRRDNAHIIVRGSASTADSDLSRLLGEAHKYASSGFSGSGMSTAQLLVVDAMYKLEPQICDKLNQFLEDSDAAFGPFLWMTDAVVKLKQLRSAKKTIKAQALERLLSDFAAAHGGDMDAVMQWPLLFKLKKTRDAFAHPCDAQALQQVLDSDPPGLVHMKGAVKMAAAH